MRWAWMGLGCLGLSVACGADDAGDADGSPTSADATDTAGSSSTGSSTTVSGTDTAAPTTEVASSTGDTGAVGDDLANAFVERIAGLWVGPVDSNTSVGDFPTMNMDVRAVDGHVLFSKVDLDPDNNLRFLFTFENHQGRRQLVFRNGGEFLGILRDTRTVLDGGDLQAGTFTFCALAGGCDYVEATFTFSAPDSMTLDVAVMSMMHFTWPATRRQERPLPVPWPSDETAGEPDDPFPPLPSLRATLQWSEPVAQDTSAWLLLGTTACGVNPANCTPSRFMRALAPAGATSVEVVLDQLHPGDYLANAILDHNGNLGQGSLLPDAGDLLALPDQAVQVAPTGETTTAITLLVEL